MADWLRGQSTRELLTYPLWGYPALLAVIPEPWLRCVQVILGASVVATAWVRWRDVTRSPGALLLMLVGAMPWYALCAGMWPTGISAAFTMLGVLALERAVTMSRMPIALWSGIAFGLAGNMRSEVQALPAVLVLVIWIVEPRPRDRRLRYGLVSAVVAFGMLLPWAFHYRSHTGHFSTTASNSGQVAFISLGQLPNNPWGIKHDDGEADRALVARGSVSNPLSDAGDRELRHAFFEAVETYPGAYARKVLHNLRSILMGGFYVGSLPCAPDAALRIDVLRERIKLKLGLNPNEREIADYHARGIWDTTNVRIQDVLSLMWQVTGTGVGVVLILLALIGALTAVRRFRAELTLSLAGATIAGQLAVCALLQYQPRHVTVVYLPLALFAAEALVTLSAFVAKTRIGLR